MRLATDLGPQSGVSGTSVSRFIDSAANALDGNGDKLRQTITELAGVSRVLANGSGNVVDIIKNLQTFVTTLRDSNEQVVSFQNRLATLTSVIDGNRSDLDAALKNLSVAIVDIQRFVAGSRNQTSEQIQRLTNVTSNLLENKMEIENVLHIAPNALTNAYNIYSPSAGSAVGQFVFNNFSNPTEFVCGAIGAIENTTAPETAKLCEQYLGPALRLLNFNYLPLGIDPYLMPAANPDDLIYSEPNLAPGAGGPISGTAGNPAGDLGIRGCGSGPAAVHRTSARRDAARRCPTAARRSTRPDSERDLVAAQHVEPDGGRARSGTRPSDGGRSRRDAMIGGKSLRRAVIAGCLRRGHHQCLCVPGCQLAAAARCRGSRVRMPASTTSRSRISRHWNRIRRS